MKKNKIIVFGAGEIAEVADYYFKHDGSRDVVAFVVDDNYLERSSFAGRPIISTSESVKRFPASDYAAFVAVGYKKVNGLREAKCKWFIGNGYDLASYISPSATIYPNVTFGWNSFILEDNTIQPFVKIGNGVTLWSGNHIGHHSIIEDYVFLSSHVVVSGGVSVGYRTFVGVNSTFNDHVIVGSQCVIGSGCLVTKNIPAGGVVVAEPATLSPVPSHRLKGF